MNHSISRLPRNESPVLLSNDLLKFSFVIFITLLFNSQANIKVFYSYTNDICWFSKKKETISRTASFFTT
ncbi:MAG TPA: hypothetical protein DC042_02195 [Bacteroidales bacterium]|nr:hypothetical protein [Bacteroidales bacterium]